MPGRMPNRFDKRLCKLLAGVLKVLVKLCQVLRRRAHEFSYTTCFFQAFRRGLGVQDVWVCNRAPPAVGFGMLI